METETPDAQDTRPYIGALLRSIEPGTWCREGLADTPRRVVKMYEELFSGYTCEVSDILKCTFEEGAEDYNGMVIVRDIPMYSMCEHHMMPFFGKVTIGYIPNKAVVGVSKLARLVDMFSHRLQIQERLTANIAMAIEGCLKPQGVMVVCEAEHLCMTMRGVQKPGTTMTTSTVTGVFEKDGKAREEFLHLISR